MRCAYSWENQPITRPIAQSTAPPKRTASHASEPLIATKIDESIVNAPNAVMSFTDFEVRWVVTTPRAEWVGAAARRNVSAIGAPHFGQAIARGDTSDPQSSHVVSGMWGIMRPPILSGQH